jgi:NitT/TauT family transport system substrate-binding protein
MNMRHRVSFMLPVLLLLAALLVSCGGGEATNNPSLKAVSIGLGYQPSIQFAPFYVAKSKGYYQNVGLDVSFDHNTITNLFGSMTAGKNAFVFGSGDELLVARDKNKDLKLVDVSTIFQKYPVSLIVPADSSIKKLEDLKGHSIGIPGPYGATYTGLLALLQKANLTLKDVDVQAINYTQVAKLTQHQVDAVMGYSNNEPLQLERSGFPVRTFAISDYQPLVSNGIVTMQETYQNQQAMVRSFVQATIKGLQDVIKDPAKAVETCKEYVPGMDAAQALEVLKATLPIYQGSGRLGYNDSAIWQQTAQFLVDQQLIKPVDKLSDVYVNVS